MTLAPTRTKTTVIDLAALDGLALTGEGVERRVRPPAQRSQLWETVDPKAEWDYRYSPYASMRGNPIFYTDPHGDVVDPFTIALISAAVIGGAGNVWRQRDTIDNIWDGITAFSIGAGAGAVGVLAPPAAAVGGTFLATVESFAAAGAVGGGVAGAINGLGNGLYFTDGDLLDRTFAGLEGGLIEGSIGVESGAAAGALFGMGAHWLRPKGGVPAALENESGSPSGGGSGHTVTGGTGAARTGGAALDDLGNVVTAFEAAPDVPVTVTFPRLPSPGGGGGLLPHLDIITGQTVKVSH